MSVKEIRAVLDKFSIPQSSKSNWSPGFADVVHRVVGITLRSSMKMGSSLSISRKADFANSVLAIPVFCSVTLGTLWTLDVDRDIILPRLFDMVLETLVGCLLVVLDIVVRQAAK